MTSPGPKWQKEAESSRYFAEMTRNYAGAAMSGFLAVIAPIYLVLALFDPMLRDPVLGLLFGAGPAAGVVTQLILRGRASSK